MLAKRAKFWLLSITFLIFIKLSFTNITDSASKISKNKYKYSITNKLKDPLAKFILNTDANQKPLSSHNVTDTIKNPNRNSTGEILVNNDEIWNKIKVIILIFMSRCMWF